MKNNELPSLKSVDYNLKWFEQRAIDGLERIDENTWDFSDSLLLYGNTQSEEAYEQIQSEGNPYNELITNPEEKYLQEIADKIVESLPKEFEYIDLGPGTAGKEKFIFEATKKQNKRIVYRPVDISAYYLEKSRKFAEEYGLEIKPIHSSFEELPEILKKEMSKTAKYVSLGLTFSNFNPQKILNLLKLIAGEKGFIFINFLVFQSLRPSKEKLLQDLEMSGLDYEIFDTGSSFVGTLLKT